MGLPFSKANGCKWLDEGQLRQCGSKIAYLFLIVLYLDNGGLS
jgi:hypothetical protein